MRVVTEVYPVKPAVKICFISVIINGFFEGIILRSHLFLVMMAELFKNIFNILISV